MKKPTDAPAPGMTSIPFRNRPALRCHATTEYLPGGTLGNCECAIRLGACKPGVRRYDDRRRHIGVQMAIHGNNARLREGHGTAFSARIVSEVERPRLRKRENVVKNRIEIREGNFGSGWHDCKIRYESPGRFVQSSPGPAPRVRLLRSTQRRDSARSREAERSPGFCGARRCRVDRWIRKG